VPTLTSLATLTSVPTLAALAALAFISTTGTEDLCLCHALR
jgi:hypothetical protein